MAHVLVVGGVGYLEKVIHFLAQHGNTVSVVARSEDSLNRLIESSGPLGDRINPIAIDFPNAHTLTTHVMEAIRRHGPVVLVVNWSHSGTQQLGQEIARILNQSSPICRFFHLYGTDDPSLMKVGFQEENPFAHLSRILFRTIVLGYPRHQGEMGQFFPENEIADAVITAVRDDRRRTTLDGLTDWEGQPRSA